MENQTFNSPKESSKAGPTIGIIIIIIVLLAGALYFLSQTAEKNKLQQATSESILEQGAVEIENLKIQSNSDTIDSIEQDLADTNLNNLDKESAAIGAEVNNLQ